ncbi:MAG: helix-turn-helix transcriptional regulator, partial [Clostridia bacterium]
MENLKNARRAKKLTQQEVADHLGIERSSYARYESGSREPDIETINALAKYLDVSVGYLSGSAVYSNADKLIDSYERSIHFWLEDQFFSASEVDRLKDHYADVLTRYKTLVESLERAKTSEKYCIGENPTAIERYLHY